MVATAVADMLDSMSPAIRTKTIVSHLPWILLLRKCRVETRMHLRVNKEHVQRRGFAQVHARRSSEERTVDGVLLCLGVRLDHWEL